MIEPTPWIPPAGQWWRVERGSICFAVIVSPQGIVAWAAPVARWAIGKPWLEVKAFYLRRGGWAEEIPAETT